MNKITDIKQINTNTIEGRYLFAAIAMLTTSSGVNVGNGVQAEINGRDQTPFQFLDYLDEMSAKILGVTETDDQIELLKSRVDGLGNLGKPMTGDRYKDFEYDLTILINRHSMESRSNTPDFILARFLLQCLFGMETMINDREKTIGNPNPS